MSSTRTLARYLSGIKYEDLPADVVERGKVAVLDTLGNCIGGYPLSLTNKFLGMAKGTGGGRGQATLIGDGAKVSVPMAAFGNGALSTMMDFCDHQRSESGRSPAWIGCLAVPGALAAGEAKGISGKELIASVIAGYECTARVLHSMDMSLEAAQIVGGETISVFASAGAAGRALGLDEDQMLSTLCMTGIYTPVPAWYKWVSEDGLTPRKDIKQGWAWMCLAGAFAAVSAEKGLQATQENNIFDGDHGLWRMLGMDVLKEDQLTAGLGQTYHIRNYSSKRYPGCAVTHTAIAGVAGLVKDNNIAPNDVEGIEVITNKHDGIGFDDRDLPGLCDVEFSMPYQVAAAILGGEKGPRWYSDKLVKSPEMGDMMNRVSLGFDDECERIYLESHMRICKVTLSTKNGQRYNTRVDEVGHAESGEEIRKKFITTTSQVIDDDRVQKILTAVDNLEAAESVSELVGLLAPLPREVR